MRRARIEACDRVEEAAAIMKRQPGGHDADPRRSLPATGPPAFEKPWPSRRARFAFATRRSRRRRYVPCMPSLTGRFRVRRVSGLLPPFGVTKRIDGSRGMTYLFGLPVGAFRVIGRRFVY